MNKYQIGLLGNKIEGWKILLDQEGIPCSILPENLTPSDLSAVIIADDAELKYDKSVSEYVKNGGSILCSAEVFGRLTGAKVVRRYIKYLLPEPLSGLVRIVDIDRNCTLMEKSNFFSTDSDTRAVLLDRYYGGYAAVLPFDCGNVILDTRSSSKSFYGKRSRLPHEEVSRVSKGGIRLLFAGLLERLHHMRGLPYVHLWYNPIPQGVPFIFRIDTDYASSEEVQKLYRLLSDFDIEATWFVDVKTQSEFLPVFRSMVNQEIALHCYEHRTYPDYLRNKNNIQKAMQLMNQNNLKPVGYASPYGRWNHQLASAVAECGFEYSSEFSYDYDNLPSVPFIDSDRYRVLQIPVHPVSIGNLRRQGYDSESMKEYFKIVTDRNISERIPVALYHHPKDGNEEVLKFIFSYIKEKNFKVQKMADFAKWWKKRCDIKYELLIDRESVQIGKTDDNCEGIIRISKPNGEETFLKLASGIDQSDLKWHLAESPPHAPADISRIRKFNPRILINKIEDALYRFLK